MLIDRDELSRVLGVPLPESVTGVDAVTHDSRAARPGGAFVAIPGFLQDGVDYAPQAVQNGAVLVVAERDVEGLPTAVVPDARVALARLAVAVAGDPSSRLTVYGVTGTNGKTTSSYVLHSILAGAHGEAGTGLMTTAEILIGTTRETAVRTTGEAPEVQGNLQRMLDAGAQHVVLETSSHGIQLHRVLGTHYAAALFTNLTRDHLDLHGTMEDYYLTKRSLFEWTAGPKLSNVDDEYGRRLATEIEGTRTFGHAPDADYRITDERVEGGGTTFTLATPQHGELSVRTPLLGDYNVHNVAGAAGVALEMGMEPAVLLDAVATMGQVPGRFERVHEATERGFEVIVDYAHTDIGLDAVLQVAREVARHDDRDGRVICVYGAAGDRDKAKRPLMGQVASRLAEVGIITTDDAYTEDPLAIAEEVMTGADRSRTTIEVDRREAIRQALEQARPGDVVVVAGKGHERVQHLPTGDVEFHDATVVRDLLT